MNDYRLGRSMALSILMVCGMLAAYVLVPTKQLSETIERIDLEKAVPVIFGDWKQDTAVATVIPSAETQETVAKIYEQTLNRTYVNGKGERVMLSIAYGGTQNRQLRAHRQEVCYAAQGFVISQLSSATLNINGKPIRATRMVASHGLHRIEPVTYWFTMGNDIVRSYLDRQLSELKYAMSGYIPDGYLFRVSSISVDVTTAFANQETFAAELLNATNPKLVQRLLGEESL